MGVNFAVVGSEALRVKVVNTGHRAVYLTFAGFATDPKRLHRKLEPFRYTRADDTGDESSTTHFMADVPKEALQPGQPLTYDVPVEDARRHFAEGYRWVEVQSSIKTRRKRIPSWVIEKLGLASDTAVSHHREEGRSG